MLFNNHFLLKTFPKTRIAVINRFKNAEGIDFERE